MSMREVVSRCEERFGINVIEPLAHQSGAHVFLATRANEDLVLKIGVNETEVTREVHALDEFSDHGAIGVRDFEGALSALLLQRAMPGHPLSSITDDERATEIFCSVFRRLQSRPVRGAHEFIQDHFSAIGRYQRTSVGPLPAPWVDRAIEYLNGLVASTDRPSLLHGDLHHANILRHQDQWVIIDPKGIVGDPHFDVIQYLLNYPARGGKAETVLRRRIAILTERLGLEAQRVARWGLAKGILDACWALEDGSDWRQGLDTAERFERWLARRGHSNQSSRP